MQKIKYTLCNFGAQGLETVRTLTTRALCGEYHTRSIIELISKKFNQLYGK